MAATGTMNPDETLNEYLERHWDTADFSAEPHYFEDGDFISFFASEEMCYAERVDDLLTVYLSEETNDLIGCKIKGVSQLAKNVEEFIGVTDGKLALGWLFLPGWYAAPSPPAKKRYLDVAARAGKLVVDISQALCASTA